MAPREGRTGTGPGSGYMGGKNWYLKWLHEREGLVLEVVYIMSALCCGEARLRGEAVWLQTPVTRLPCPACTYVGHCTLLSGSLYSIVASLFVSSKGLLTLFLLVRWKTSFCFGVPNRTEPWYVSYLCLGTGRRPILAIPCWCCQMNTISWLYRLKISLCVCVSAHNRSGVFGWQDYASDVRPSYFLCTVW